MLFHWQGMKIYCYNTSIASWQHTTVKHANLHYSLQSCDPTKHRMSTPADGREKPVTAREMKLTVVPYTGGILLSTHILPPRVYSTNVWTESNNCTCFIHIYKMNFASVSCVFVHIAMYAYMLLLATCVLDTIYSTVSCNLFITEKILYTGMINAMYKPKCILLPPFWSSHKICVRPYTFYSRAVIPSGYWLCAVTVGKGHLEIYAQRSVLVA